MDDLSDPHEPSHPPHGLRGEQPLFVPGPLVLSEHAGHGKKGKAEKESELLDQPAFMVHNEDRIGEDVGQREAQGMSDGWNRLESKEFIKTTVTDVGPLVFIQNGSSMRMDDSSLGFIDDPVSLLQDLF